MWWAKRWPTLPPLGARVESTPHRRGASMAAGPRISFAAAVLSLAIGAGAPAAESGMDEPAAPPSSAGATQPAAPHVELFSPLGTAKQVRQVVARFSVPIVALGD